MALIKCPECGAEISDKAACCPKCGASVEGKNNTSSSMSQAASEYRKSYQAQQKQEPDFVRKQKQKTNSILLVAMVVFGIILAVATIAESSKSTGPSYYIAQIPSEIGNASFNWTGVIDGYIHKDKKCCQSVVDYWNSSLTSGSELEAELVKINPDSTAYKNRMGQAVSYEVALSYCPLCRGW